MKVSATEAKNRFGQVLEQAQSGPVFIEKAGRKHSVVLSVKQYEQLSARGGPKTSNAGKEFYKQYREWVDEQNARVREHGIWNAAFRQW